jgi:hypothetical protein
LVSMIKQILYGITMLLLFCSLPLQAECLAKGKRFEVSGYVSMASLGKNIYLQADITGGINLLRFLNFSIGSSLGYRNYSFTTLDFLSVSVGKSVNNSEFRVGGIAGLYTLRFSGYQSTMFSAGGEILYAYNVSPNLSIRMKERIYTINELQHNVLSTSTFAGLCYSFGNFRKEA